MLVNYYKLTEQPFGVTPDPRFLYLGTQHREALASLEYTTESNRGFVAMIAKPGMGKTSILYRYLEGLRHRAQTAFVFRTDCNAREFMRHVLLDLGIDLPADDLPTMHDALNRVLKEGRSEKQLPFVLVIDEAQNLSESVLESIRLLSNFETPWMKLMQIVLVGQPQLADHLAKPAMVQLRQRIAQVIRIEPLTPEEVSEYIDCRLEAAGCRDLSLFTRGSRAAIAHYSEGIPRMINTICFGAMSLACATKRRSIDRNMVMDAMADLALGPGADAETTASEPVENTTGSLSRQRAARREGRTITRWVPRFVLGASLLAIFFLGFRVNVDEPPRVTPAGAATEMPANAGTATDVTPESAVIPDGLDPSPAASTPPLTSAVVSSGGTIHGIDQPALESHHDGILNEMQKPNPRPKDPNQVSVRPEILPLASRGTTNQQQRGATPNGASGPPKQANE